jgi:hypothetical protein
MLVVIRTVVRGMNKRGKRRGMYVPSYSGCTTQILTWGPIADRQVFGGSVGLFSQTDRVGPDRCTRSRSTTLKNRSYRRTTYSSAYLEYHDTPADGPMARWHFEHLPPLIESTTTASPNCCLPAAALLLFAAYRSPPLPPELELHGHNSQGKQEGSRARREQQRQAIATGT